MPPRPPLFVQVIFHPKSDRARNLAMGIYHALNDDSLLPGLRVPTVFAREDGSTFPPTELDPDEAERSVLVVLADDKMLLEPPVIPEGRKTWSCFVGDLYDSCKNSVHRFLPVQLSEHAWPLDPRLSSINFLRAYLQGESDLSPWLVRRLIVEICRFLMGEDRGERLPLRLFLSHAKQDIKDHPAVFDSIVSHLTTTQPVETWVDSAKIEGGSKFGDEIAKGVKDCIMLALVTKSYGSREWCRKEILLAKRHQRPLVVVDAHEGIETRSFPYGGNTPRIRWAEGGATDAVELLLKETLRSLHVRLLLMRQKKDTDHILTSSPEPTTVAKSPPGATILYPDPPVGDEEEEELEALGRSLETPMLRAAEGRRLAKRSIILSCSESGDTLRHGLTQKHLDAALLEISRHLLVRGAILEYGGHLGADGYTTALFELARSHNATSGMTPAERIVNDVGWPLPLETLPDSVRARNSYVARFRRIPRPDGVAHLEPETFKEEPEFFPANTPARRYAWARGMTEMRCFQANKSGATARVVIGGRIGPTISTAADGTTTEKWYMGRIPGVVEEVLLSLRAGQPVYLVGAFGGAAEAVIDMLEGRQRPDFAWEFHKRAPHAEAMRELFAKEGSPWEDYDSIKEFFSSTGILGLANLNKLNPNENRELFHSRDLTGVIGLILKGLAQL